MGSTIAQAGARTGALFLLEQGGVDFSGHPLLPRWQGDLLVRENRFVEAETVLARVLEPAPTDPHTLDTLARFALALGSYEQIAQAHLQAVRHTPTPGFVARYLLLAAFRPEFDGPAFRARVQEFSAWRQALRRRLQYSPLMNAQRYGQAPADRLYRL